MRQLFLLLSLLPVLASAEPVHTGHVTAELVEEMSSVKPGGKIWVGVRMEYVPSWHTYWEFPGDSGLPTKVKWRLPEGWRASEAAWQIPERITMPPLVNYGYEKESLLGFELTVPAGEKLGRQRILAAVSWLVCKEECIPEKVELQLDLPVSGAAPKPKPWAENFVDLRAQQPRPLPPGATVEAQNGKIGLRLPAGADWVGTAQMDFLPLAPELLKGDQPPERAGGVLWMEAASPFSADARALQGILIGRADKKIQFVYHVDLPLSPAVIAAAKAAPAAQSAEAAAPAESAGPAWMAVLLAFLGGAILNLMPCVFPVLGIKVMSLLRQHKPAVLRRHGQSYTAGVVVSFWLLAGALVFLRSAGEAVGWGFQLQHPGFVVLLILLFSFVTADLAGFVEWGGTWMGAGADLANRDGISGSFFTGMLAVVVATPCTAPFMGTAMGAALGEPAWIVFLIFTALGFGLAFPFLLLCYQPGLFSFLPKPGAWMERLKEFFAFPMAATVLWLLWVLSLQIGAGGALRVELGLLIVLVAAWLRHRFRGGRGNFVSLLFLLAGLAFSANAVMGEAKESAQSAWKPYSQPAIAEALAAGKPVFVDFTAAWCLTCQVNRKLVLESSSTQEYFRAKNVVLLEGDWTNHDAEITKALEQQGRLGVPLYLAYSPGAAKPAVLPQLLTESALRAAFP